MRMEKIREKGFTLIEIAIVLVIIGILLGGILKGRELIFNSKVKKIKADFDNISAAVYSYQDRFKVLPGDDGLADKHVNGTNATAEGVRNNGIIDGAWNSTLAGDESVLLWQHLRLAGFLTGSNTTAPQHVFGGIIGVQDNIYGFSGQVVCFQNITGRVATTLDTSYDDGLADGGTIRAVLGTSQPSTSYEEATAYDLCLKI